MAIKAVFDAKNPSQSREFVFLGHSHMGTTNDSWGHIIPETAKIAEHFTEDFDGIAAIDIEPVPAAGDTQPEIDDYWTQVEAAITAIKAKAPAAKIGLYGHPSANLNDHHHIHIWVYERGKADWAWYDTNLTGGSNGAQDYWDWLEHNGDQIYNSGGTSRYANIDYIMPNIYEQINKTSDGNYANDRWVQRFMAEALIFGQECGCELLPYVWGKTYDSNATTHTAMTDQELRDYAGIIQPWLKHPQVYGYVLWQASNEGLDGWQYRANILRKELE